MLFNLIKDSYIRQTGIAYTVTRLLNAPFWVLHMLLPFMLAKELDATPWQIACLTSLRPIVSLFSWYWSVPIQRRRDRLIPNIVWANVLGHLPFLFVPLVTNIWFFIFASAIYMLFYRGMNPAWMEILKINVPEESRRNLFAFGSALYHVGGSILAIGIGWLLDVDSQAWRWLFPITALLSLGASLIQIKLPLKFEHSSEERTSIISSFSFTKPWKDAWDLMKRRPDFAYFQIGFMLGGGGLMLWQPALPQFFFTVLKVNYKELSLAITLCKSIGYALALPLWTRLMSRMNIFIFSGIVTAIAALSPLSLMIAQWNLVWLYVAYLLYGIMQAGSEMSWNLSGPIFSKQENSSLYSGVNVMTIGLRGCIAPTLGGMLCYLTNESVVLVVGALLCLLATWQMIANRQTEENPYALSS
jgi:MFS family permease